MKVLFLIRSLAVGGAERQLVNLAKGLHERGHEVAVAVYYGDGLLQDELDDLRISVLDLEKSGRWDVVPFLMRLVRTVRDFRPEVIYGFLGTASILTVLMKLFFPRMLVVWGVRASNVELDFYDWFARTMYRAERWLSRFADLIICNSRAGLEHAAANGFPRSKITVIPNGTDIDRFQFDAKARDVVRREWRVEKNELLVGTVARLDPMKGHLTVLQAAALLRQDRQDVRFCCVGDGPAQYADRLCQASKRLGLDGVILWPGMRRDMPAVYSALDLLVLPSMGEGHPNVVTEAMACGVMCIVTDVGDAAYIVGECGIVVPPSSPALLRSGMEEGLRRVRLDRVNVARQCRSRIANHYSVGALVDRTVAAISECA